MKTFKIYNRYEILKGKTDSEHGRDVIKPEKVKRCERFPGTCMHAWARGSSGRSSPYDRKRKKATSCHDEKDCGNMVNDVGPDPMFFDENGEPLQGWTGVQG